MSDPTPPAPITVPKQPIADYLWGVAAKKVSLDVAKVVVGLATSLAVKAVLDKYGIFVDREKLMSGVTLLVATGLSWAHDYLKVKYGIAWL